MISGVRFAKDAFRASVVLILFVAVSTWLTAFTREPPLGAGWAPGRGALVKVDAQEASRRFGVAPREVWLWPDRPQSNLDDGLASTGPIELYDIAPMDAWHKAGRPAFITALDVGNLQPLPDQDSAQKDLFARLRPGRKQAGWGLMRRSAYHARRFFDYWRSDIPDGEVQGTGPERLIRWFTRDGNALSQNVGHFVPFALASLIAGLILRRGRPQGTGWFWWAVGVGVIHGVAYEYIAEGCYCDPSTSDIYTNMVGGMWGACMAAKIVGRREALGDGSDAPSLRFEAAIVASMLILLGIFHFPLKEAPRGTWAIPAAAGIVILYLLLATSCLAVMRRMIRLF